MNRALRQRNARVMRTPVDDEGRILELCVRERNFRQQNRRFDQVLDYVLDDAFGAVERRSRERLTFYAADPAPFALAAGLEPDDEPSPLGGAGEIHRLRKLAADA